MAPRNAIGCLKCYAVLGKYKPHSGLTIAPNDSVLKLKHQLAEQSHNPQDGPEAAELYQHDFEYYLHSVGIDPNEPFALYKSGLNVFAGMTETQKIDALAAAIRAHFSKFLA